MRRKPGALVPLEEAICRAAAELHRRGVAEFYGYHMAKQLADEREHASLAAYGTLYRALGRLQEMGLLTSRWEDVASAGREGRPPRRLYALTALGRSAAREARNAALARAGSRRRKGWAPA